MSNDHWFRSREHGPYIRVYGTLECWNVSSIYKLGVGAGCVITVG